MNNIKVSLALAIAVTASLRTTTAEAQCIKWNNQLQPGEESAHNPGVKLPTAPEQTASLAKERFFWRIVLSDDTDTACKKMERYGSNNQLEADKVRGGPTGNCFNDQNGDGAQDPANPLENTKTTVSPDTITTEACCQYDSNAFPNPPHALDPDKFYKTDPTSMMVAELDPAPGLSFQGSDVKYDMALQVSQKAQFIAANAPTMPPFPNSFRSDLSGFAVAGFESDDGCEGRKGSGAPKGTLWYQRGVSTHDQCAAEVDHIIPRVDVHGCPCGSNSSKNAQLISRRLNGWLSNDCNPARPAGRARLKIIDDYANGLLPLAGVAPPGSEQLDASDTGDDPPVPQPTEDADAASGCALERPSQRHSGQSALVLLLGLAGLSFARRRQA